MQYFKDIYSGITSIKKGLGLTFNHIISASKRRSQNNIQKSDYFNFDKGLTTLQYPKEKIPVPEIGRYQLHNEIDDCIVCDKCAKVCPVDCIEIDPIKATEEIGYTSDGTPKKIYAATFDIDMAKCCFCGLCTTVCPTECLTMTSEYDFSTFSISNMNFEFANLSKDEAEEKRTLLAQFQAEKEALKQQKTTEVKAEEVKSDAPAKPKIAFKPIIKK